MATVHHWTGLEARALRLALRLSVRAFAQHLGVGIRTVSKWEKLLAATEPRQDTQAILDTALTRSNAAVHLRFETFRSEAGQSGQVSGRGSAPSAPGSGSTKPGTTTWTGPSSPSPARTSPSPTTCSTGG